jgi:hypothetical protein
MKTCEDQEAKTPLSIAGRLPASNIASQAFDIYAILHS